jgi:F-type H+-transporting ATPase subunit epsilon
MSNSMKRAVPTLQLKLISQERQLLDLEVESLTLPTSMGTITILPDHVPIVSELVTGEVHYMLQGKMHYAVVSNGFLNFTPDNIALVMVDSAEDERGLSTAKAEAAIQAAKAAVTTARDRQELLQAEASLRRALLEQKVAQKTHRIAV